MNDSDAKHDNSVLLQGVELVLANPAAITTETAKVLAKIEKKYARRKTANDIKLLASRKVIDSYASAAAYSGGATALAGVIPGLGTVIATLGGATADAALTMKYQVEMTMAIAWLYGHDIETAEIKRECFIVAGLGVLNEPLFESGKQLGSKAFYQLASSYIKGASWAVVMGIFRRISTAFAKTAITKGIPFGFGVAMSYLGNRKRTRYVGSKAQEFFAEYESQLGA